jgi:hypothetical protein
MAEKLEKKLNEIVLASNEIDAIVVLDPVEALALYHNTEYSKDTKRNGKVLYENYEDIASTLNQVNKITDTLNEFGEASERGELNYAIFQLSGGILILYFLEIKEPVVVAFISGTQEGLGLLLKHSKQNIDDIEKLLNEVL